MAHADRGPASIISPHARKEGTNDAQGISHCAVRGDSFGWAIIPTNPQAIPLEVPGGLGLGVLVDQFTPKPDNLGIPGGVFLIQGVTNGDWS